MRLLASVVGLALLVAQQVVCVTPPPGADSLQACSSVVTRKEVRDLSPEEWSAYSSAVQSAYNDRWIDWFGFLHDRVAGVIHSNAVFLVYHRKMTRDYEQILQQYNPSVAVPFWNTLIDYQNPGGSPVLSDSYFGGNGNAASDNCVTGGIAGSWKLTFPDVHCLRRNFGEADTIKSWYSPEFITSVLQRSTAYSDLRAGLENTIHGLPHLSLGGDMNTMHSPLDPVFWLHHSNIDRLFSQWQAVNPDERTYAYDGTDIKNNAVSLNDHLTSTTTPVYEVMRLGYGSMCYTYSTIQAAGGSSNNLARRQKCIVRPSKATEAVRKLPPKLLSSYYPSFAKGGVVSALENELGDYDPRRPMSADGVVEHKPFVASEKMRGHMPKAGTLDNMYIKMMGANVTEVKQFEKMADEMVDALNSENYLSPYLVDLLEKE